jgi:Tol biopolymer transport system component/DNA-binding winged helix-turn-helix (wHTH) protein
VPNAIYHFGEFRLDAGRRLLFREGVPEALNVTPKVVDALLLFAQHPHELLDKDRLMSELWPGLVVEESSITQVIYAARRVLGEARGENRYIVTVPGRGYRFAADVTLRDAAADERPARRSSLRFVVASAAALCVAAVAAYLLLATNRQPRSANPLDEAVIRRFTDLDGSELDPALSPDGKLIAFLSDREGTYDVWVGGIAGGEFINLTKGRFARMHMDQLHTVGFNPDGTVVWLRAFERNEAGQDVPTIWLVPVTGGAPRRFLDNTVHLAWSPDGKRLVYQQYTPGDPLFLAAADGSDAQQLFVDEPGRHCHMLAWSPDGRYIYFVRGPHPTREMDVWRIPAAGGAPQRLTHHNSRVGYPTPLDDRTLLYTATVADDTAASLYAMDLTTRTTRRVSMGVEEYPTVSSGSGAARRMLVATVSNPKSGLFTVPIADAVLPESAAQRLDLPVAHAVSPRFGPGFVLYLSSRHGAHGLWKLADGTLTELWRSENGGVIGPPNVANDGGSIVFPVHKQGRHVLYAVRSDGSELRSLTSALDVLDAGSWSADGRWLAISGRDQAGSRVFKVAADGSAVAPLTEPVSLLPLWSPDGAFLIYSQSVNGPGYAVRAVTAEGKSHALPELWVPRGGDRYRFMPGGNAMVLLLEENGRQNFWLFDLRSGSRRQLTDLAQEAAIRSFDVSRDGKQIIFDRIRDNADIVLIDLKR